MASLIGQRRMSLAQRSSSVRVSAGGEVAEKQKPAQEHAQRTPMR